LDTENQAKSAKSATTVRMALERNVTTLIDLPKPLDVQSFYHDRYRKIDNTALQVVPDYRLHGGISVQF